MNIMWKTVIFLAFNIFMKVVTYKLHYGIVSLSNVPNVKTKHKIANSTSGYVYLSESQGRCGYSNEIHCTSSYALIEDTADFREQNKNLFFTDSKIANAICYELEKDSFLGKCLCIYGEVILPKLSRDKKSTMTNVICNNNCLILNESNLKYYQILVKQKRCQYANCEVNRFILSRATNKSTTKQSEVYQRRKIYENTTACTDRFCYFNDKVTKRNEVTGHTKLIEGKYIIKESFSKTQIIIFSINALIFVLILALGMIKIKIETVTCNRCREQKIIGNDHMCGRDKIEMRREVTRRYNKIKWLQILLVCLSAFFMIGGANAICDEICQMKNYQNKTKRLMGLYVKNNYKFEVSGYYFDIDRYVLNTTERLHNFLCETGKTGNYTVQKCVGYTGKITMELKNNESENEVEGYYCVENSNSTVKCQDILEKYIDDDVVCQLHMPNKRKIKVEGYFVFDGQNWYILETNDKFKKSCNYLSNRFVPSDSRFGTTKCYYENTMNVVVQPISRLYTSVTPIFSYSKSDGKEWAETILNYETGINKEEFGLNCTSKKENEKSDLEKCQFGLQNIIFNNNSIISLVPKCENYIHISINNNITKYPCYLQKLPLILNAKYDICGIMIENRMNNTFVCDCDWFRTEEFDVVYELKSKDVDLNILITIMLFIKLMIVLKIIVRNPNVEYHRRTNIVRNVYAETTFYD